eukprot:GHVP01004264.1.p1 GENE.GHVP01004264.1~~GHVP01004264.1.p1  ORF type:complete len:558 (+),score=122.04 GHVP01004264.1:2-1675(+)
MKCPSCASADLQEDPYQGVTYCTECGMVLEESAVVSDVQFVDRGDGGKQVQGQFVSSGGSRSMTSKVFGKRIYTSDSRETTIYKTKKNISAVGNSIGINQQHVELAVRWYTLALQNDFTRGRLSSAVIGSCIYIVCRQEKTPHMLIDLSEVLGLDVFSLGAVFLKLVRTLRLQIPLIDPSFYIQRFASKLEFGNKTNDVINTALRVIARMKRDWILTGRRPVGITGASLIIAGKIHGFHRSEKDLSILIKLGKETIKRRLDEFSCTKSAELTPLEFNTMWLDDEKFPPCYKKSGMKQLVKPDTERIVSLLEYEKENELKHEALTMEKIRVAIDENTNDKRINKIDDKIGEANKDLGGLSNGNRLKIRNTIDGSNKDINTGPNMNTCSQEEATVDRNKEEQEMEKMLSTIEDKPNPSNNEGDPNTEGLAMERILSNIHNKDGIKTEELSSSLFKENSIKELLHDKKEEALIDEESISDVEIDSEMEYVNLSEDEINLRSQLWMADNTEYLDEPNRIKIDNKNNSKREKRTRKSNSTKDNAPVKSKKINYQALEELFYN